MIPDVRCRTVLISDAPNPRDVFDPHRRVAGAIANLIHSEPAGGKSIGLQGSWGSGKTTVVKFLAEELKNLNKNYLMIEFDAWAHEGDPLRRTFLETLIRPLEQLEGIDRDDLEKKKEQLAQRRELKTTTTIPQLTPIGKFLIFSLFLIPIGGFCFSLASKENITIGGQSGIAWWFIVMAATGLLLTMAPIVVILFAPFLAVSLNWLDRRKNKKAAQGEEPAASDQEISQSNPVSNDGTDLWAMIFGRAYTKVVTDTAKTPNPTSIEFEETFASLMSAAFKNPERKIILVLDNLDRVAASDALAIWSTMQTFLQRAEVFERLWILVLYDPRALRLLWDKEESEQSRIALSFIDKSFQIKFQVSPSLVSDWHRWLDQLLEEALPDHYAHDRLRRRQEFHEVYRLFLIYLDKGGRLMTPREMKLFVNQIGSFHRQWEDRFPLAVMAYYALIQRRDKDLKEIEQGLVSGTLPDREYEALLGAEARENLAALLFNVEVNAAKQLLLTGPINKALADKDTVRLKQFADTHDGFWEVLERIAAESWAEGEAATITNAAQILLESRLLVDSDRPEAKTVIDGLSNGASNVPAWSPFDKEMAQGIGSVFKLRRAKPLYLSFDAHEEEFVVNILKRVTANLTELEKEQIVDVSQWVEAMGELLKTLSESQPVDGLIKGVIDPIIDRLRAPNNPVPKDVRQLLQALWELQAFDFSQSENRVSEIIKSLAEEGHILHQLKNVNTGEEINPHSLAWCVFIQLSAVPNASNPPAIGNSTEGHSDLMTLLLNRGGTLFDLVAKSILEILAKYKDMALIFRVLDALPASSPFVQSILEIASSRWDADDLFQTDIVIDRWQIIYSALKGDIFSLVQFLVKKSNIIEEITLRDFNRNDATLYEAILSTDKGALDLRFQGWCADGLRHTGKEDWLNQLYTGGSLVKLVYGLAVRGAWVSLGQEFEDALVEHAQAVINAEAEVKTDDANVIDWHNLGLALDNSERRISLHLRILDLALNSNGLIPAGFFDLWGEPIGRAEIICQDIDSAIERLFIPLVAHKNVRGLRWIADMLKLDSPFSNDLRVSDLFRLFEGELMKAIYTDLLGDRVKIRRKEGASPIKSLTVKRGHSFEGWEPDPLKNEFEVDWAVAAAALKTGSFEESPDSPGRQNRELFQSPNGEGNIIPTVPEIFEIGVLLGIITDLSSLDIGLIISQDGKIFA